MSSLYSDRNASHLVSPAASIILRVLRSCAIMEMLSLGRAYLTRPRQAIFTGYCFPESILQLNYHPRRRRYPQTMRFSALLPLAALLSTAASQDPNNPDNMSPCLVCSPRYDPTQERLEEYNANIVNQLVCNEQAATAAGCVTYLDTDCTCPKQAFVDMLKRCLAAACTPEDEGSRFSLCSLASRS